MEINLLPKRSLYAEYRFLIIPCLLLLLIGGAAGGLVWNWQTDTELSQLQSDLFRVQSDNIVLRAERNPDSKTRLFNDIQTAVQEVQQKQHDDGQMLDVIAANLSSKMRVTHATMDGDKQLLTLEVQSDSVDDIADYAVLLRKEPWVQDVFVQSVKNTTTVEQPNQQVVPFTSKVEITLAPTTKK